MYMYRRNYSVGLVIRRKVVSSITRYVQVLGASATLPHILVAAVYSAPDVWQG